MKRLHVLAATLIIAASMPAAALEPPLYDLVISNGKVIDGSGNSWLYADVAVKDGRIAAVGDLDETAARNLIDGSGLVVAPGFIDVHTHADDDLYEHPLAENFIRDGVTTIVTGNCGGSVEDVGEYFARLDKEPASLNVATLYGHNTVLKQVKGDMAGELTEEQWAQAKDLIRKAMKDGAVGFSTGLIYTPGLFSKTDEIIEMQRVAAEYGGIYVSHMRSEGPGILEGIEEALRIGRESNSRVQISHFKLALDVEPKIGGAATTLGKVYEARRNGQEVWVDQYPYTASSTGLSAMLPDWVLEDRQKLNEILGDPEQLPRVLEDMKQNHESARGRTSMAYAVLASSRAYPEFAGKNIEEIARIQKYLRANPGADWKAAQISDLPSVTMEEQYKTIIDIQLKGGAGMVYHSFSEKAVEDIMKSPLVAICSDSGVRVFGSGMPHPRGYGSNARVLGRYVRERGTLTLEDAIRKMTTLPATAFRLKDRGAIREGHFADIVVFDPDTVTDKSTFTDPHNYSVGFKYVIVNGVPVVESDAITGSRPGMVVRRSGEL